ncbi:MAG: hypothetical protein ACJAYB_001606 [Psychromonas sp.]|jgi:hypothetical protein
MKYFAQSPFSDRQAGSEFEQINTTHALLQKILAIQRLKKCSYYEIKDSNAVKGE